MAGWIEVSYCALEEGGKLHLTIREDSAGTPEADILCAALRHYSAELAKSPLNAELVKRAEDMLAAISPFSEEYHEGN